MNRKQIRRGSAMMFAVATVAAMSAAVLLIGRSAADGAAALRSVRAAHQAALAARAMTDLPAESRDPLELPDGTIVVVDGEAVRLSRGDRLIASWPLNEEGAE